MSVTFITPGTLPALTDPIVVVEQYSDSNFPGAVGLRLRAYGDPGDPLPIGAFFGTGKLVLFKDRHLDSAWDADKFGIVLDADGCIDVAKISV